MNALVALAGLDVPFPVVMLGAIVGVPYGLLAVGIVLVYRSNRVINFAHGETGVFAAAVFGLLTVEIGIPYYVALPVGLATGAAVAAISEVAVIRRLRNAPRLMSIVATLGVGQLLVAASIAVNSQSGGGILFPRPPGMPEFDLGALRVNRTYSAMLLAGPLVAVALALFLRWSRFGLAIRGAAANPEAARMSGVFVGRMSSLAWGIAGGISALTAILVAPTLSVSTGESLGPSLLLMGLAGAVLGGMTSFTRALAAGVALGVVEQVLLWNYPRGGVVQIALFGIILVALLLQRRIGGREAEKESWAAVQSWPPIPAAARELWIVRNLGKLVAAAALAVLALLPLFVSNHSAIILIGMMGFAIVGLSVSILTGLGGQLSLGQFALAAVGATVSYHVTSRTDNFPLAVLLAGLAAGAVSLVIGIPALRIRGVMLAVTTLAFALATPAWLLRQSWMLDTGAAPGRPSFAGRTLDTGRSYYFFALALLVVTFVLTWNVRRTGFGRKLIAVRDNEDNARAFAIRARAVKIQGFVVAGFLAGVGGVVYGHMLSLLTAGTFSARLSIDVVVSAVIGGVATLSGPLVGVGFVIGVPAFVPLDAAGLAASRLGLLFLLLLFPGGLTQQLRSVRDWIVRALAARAGVTLTPDRAAADGAATTPVPALQQRAPAPAAARRVTPPIGHPSTNGAAGTGEPGPPLLEAHGLCKRFGGIRAVDEVSLSVLPGETLGLIGPNGAGKTTLFELLGGFQRPDSGRVVLDGRDVTRLGPETRGRLGLIRSFQDAALFPTMTVTETLMLACELSQPTRLGRALVGVARNERTQARLAAELVELMGLGDYRDKRIQELSTGTRRVCELGCLMALRPRLLLLDEPSSGIAQRETEALGSLLMELRCTLDVTLVVIEHDIPLLMGISDRVIAMDAGHVIACGPPEVVRADPRVVEAYLGGSIEAIERSGEIDYASSGGRR